MVPFTLPGEKVRVRVYRNHKNYSEADLLEVLTPSPHRQEPRCALFGRCGGCQYQHLAYPEQLKWKQQQVTELLKYMAGVEFPVAPVIASPKEFGYRSKITPHFHAQENTGAPGAPLSAASGQDSHDLPVPAVNLPPIGFLKTGNRFALIDVPTCPIATAEINAKLPEVRAKTHQRLAAGEYKRYSCVTPSKASPRTTMRSFTNKSAPSNSTSSPVIFSRTTPLFYRHLPVMSAPKLPAAGQNSSSMPIAAADCSR